ncbi:hypothetical protein N4Q55_01520 [Salmonella enterica subsp. enterica serovar Pomona]|uniref:hypothetical protein n=1 Tax=Salmonella enterica TaxID=28901 RepID=UPI00372F0E43
MNIVNVDHLAFSFQLSYMRDLSRWYEFRPVSGCGLLADLPDGSSLFFNSFEEFLAFFFAEFPDAQLVPLFREGEDEYC